MKINSLISNVFLRLHCLFCTIAVLTISGCYSFTGGTIPEHLNTLAIMSVDDKSGFGDPRYKEELTRQLIEEFENDGSFQSLVTRNGDARLSVTIRSIRDETATVKPGELESERKVTLNCEAIYYDRINKAEIWKRNFSAYEVYELTNAQQGRHDAIMTSIGQISEDIMLAVVSGW